MAIGNIVGSNIFNILAVLAIPCVIAPTRVDPEVLWRDYALMLILTLLLIAFAYSGRSDASISRLKGAFLISIWLGYLVFLYNSALG